MPLTQVVSGNRILASDLNAFYNLLKGVAASGEAVTLIFNATGSLILQPSSDPATGTELIQIKNNAGTVQSALSSDGKAYIADGVLATPGYAFESQKNTGMWRSAANTIDFSANAIRTLQLLTVATGVNYITLTPAVTTGAPIIAAAGSDTNVALHLRGQGTAGGSSVFVGSNYADYFQLIYITTSLIAIVATGSDTDIDIRLQPKGVGVVDLNYAVVALGGGAAPTVGTIGGSGPAAAAQNSWLKVKIAGVSSYLPVWR